MAITYHAGRRIQGTSTESSEYKIITFTNTSNTSFEITSGSGNVEYLVVAGGGGGYHAGGGAGGFRTGTLTLSTTTGTSGTHTVTVGAGGAFGNNGSNSVFDSITSTGGGAGASNGNNGNSGGSGGGGAGSGKLGGSGTSGQGNSGGNGGNVAASTLGGGGGGADSAGSGTTPGSGKINPISGSTQGELSGGVYYLAGGGGGGNQSGGLGGGGNFVSSANSSTNGTNGTGGGGGGHFDNGNGNIYQNGGSGVIILKYKSEEITATVTNGTTTTVTETTQTVKPTNVQVGSRYEETDTRKMYNLKTYPIYSEDFTTDPAGWTDDSYTNRTNNQVEIRPSTSSSASGVAYIDLSNASNLGSNLSDTKWTVDFKIDVVTITQSVTNYVYVRYWLSDNTSSSNSGDEIGFNHWARNTESGRARFYKVNGGTGATLSTHVGAINSTGVRYCRIIRESATSARLLISTNADWSNAVDSGSQTIDSTINALKYFKITCTGYNGSNRLNVNLDDLRVYDGVDKGTTAFETGTPDTSSKVWQEIGA